MKNKIKVQDAVIWHKGVSEASRIFCDEIEYLHSKVKDRFDHHLMFYYKGRLVFKVWLPNEPEDKKFKDIDEALKSVRITKL